MWGVSSELVDEALRGVERVSSWPIQALNVALFAIVLGICWVFVQNTRKDMTALQKSHEDERREYIASLRGLVQDSSKIIERNSVIFERIDRRLERLEEQKRIGH
jgi:hypothetical protein